MKSRLGWTLFSVIGTFALMATALAVETEMGQNLVINGDFEKGNTGFTTGYTLGDVSGAGAYFIDARSVDGAWSLWGLV